jgi:hypothetical protein
MQPVSDGIVEKRQRTVCLIIEFMFHIGGGKLDSPLLQRFRFQSDTIRSLLSNRFEDFLLPD